MSWLKHIFTTFGKPESPAIPMPVPSHEKCPGCGRSGGCWPRHAHDCPYIDLETARGYMGSISSLHKSRDGWIKHYQRMEGRFHVLRHENNRLRVLLRKAGIIK